MDDGDDQVNVLCGRPPAPPVDPKSVLTMKRELQASQHQVVFRKDSLVFQQVELDSYLAQPLPGMPGEPLPPPTLPTAQPSLLRAPKRPSPSRSNVRRDGRGQQRHVRRTAVNKCSHLCMLLQPALSARGTALSADAILGRLHVHGFCPYLYCAMPKGFSSNLVSALFRCRLPACRGVLPQRADMGLFYSSKSSKTS